MSQSNAGSGADTDTPWSARLRPYLRTPTPDARALPPTPGSTPASALRPFVLTTGRVAEADRTISLETQVVRASPGPPGEASPLSALTPEQRSILTICAEPLSLAEISAQLRLHLGVTRVLVGDLLTGGQLSVHSHRLDESADPDILLRVLDGLRALC
ncbi:DUF742 domain-containing protein [Micromonospora sp. NPDC049366]|uniref:DUF742 domain-containing protein n=1 Tax=Micromonospora sp. NPDC049366 TaxID=3364271 RepID=UPI0037A2EF7D